jgi:hypothetical protein
MKDISKELPIIAETLKKHGIEFVIIGGIAGRAHQLYRVTEDLDILIDIKDKQKFLDELVDKGYHTFKPKYQGSKIQYKWIADDKINVDFLFSDINYESKNGSLTYEKPKFMSQTIGDIPYLSLNKFIEYKLLTWKNANRGKDLADVQELIRYWKLDREYAEKNHFNEKSKELYEEVWDNSPTNLPKDPNDPDISFSNYTDEEE